MAITLMRWMARGIGLIGVTLDSYLALFTVAGTRSVGLADLGYVIACFGSFLTRAEGGLAEGIGGAMMIVGGLGMAIGVLTMLGVSDALFWAVPLVLPGIVFVICRSTDGSDATAKTE